MKKSIFSFAFLLVTLISMAQIQPPLNLTWLSSKQTVANVVGASKQYSSETLTTNCSIVSYKDVNIGTRKYLLLMGFFYKNQLVKVSLMSDLVETWYDVKSDYNRICEAFVTKYGKSLLSNKIFTSPYEEGDGYEMQALRMKKLEMVSYWTDAYENYISVTLESSDSYGYFSIAYEHSKFGEYVDEIRALEASDL
jgi:hypothetical protein